MGRQIDSIEKLISDLREGRTSVSPEVAKQLRPELEKIEHDADGSLVLDSCSPALRAFARAYRLASTGFEDGARTERAQNFDPTDQLDVATYNRELFDALETFFARSTGYASRDFVRDGETFGQSINRIGKEMRRDPNLASRRMQESSRAVEILVAHYRNNISRILPAVRSLGGTKLVLGGKQSFSQASFDAVRSMLLYADTILIPDPVFPWFETDRGEESFKHVRMLESAWSILMLKPLVDANLAIPPIVVFPSMEKLLEQRDEQTRYGIERDTIMFFSHYLDARFDDMTEIMTFAGRHPNRFFESVKRHSLFVPAGGGSIGMDLRDALAMQRRENERWRSEAYLAELSKLSDAEFVLHSICERLVPLFHLSDNASALRCAPLVSLPVHWHYLKLRSATSAEDAIAGGATDRKTLALVQTLENGPTRWLGNVALADIVRLRRDGANADFRSRMSKVLDRLGDTDLADLSVVAGEVAHEFRTIVSDHDAELNRIEATYQPVNVGALATSIFTAAASMTPWLSSFVPAAAISGAAVARAASYAAEIAEKRQHKRSLVGILAASARKVT